MIEQYFIKYWDKNWSEEQKKEEVKQLKELAECDSYAMIDLGCYYWYECKPAKLDKTIKCFEKAIKADNLHGYIYAISYYFYYQHDIDKTMMYAYKYLVKSKKILPIDCYAKYGLYNDNCKSHYERAVLEINKIYNSGTLTPSEKLKIHTYLLSHLSDNKYLLISCTIDNNNRYNIVDIYNCLVHLQQTIERLEKKNKELNDRLLAVEFMPGGLKYNEVKTEFESLTTYLN